MIDVTEGHFDLAEFFPGTDPFRVAIAALFLVREDVRYAEEGIGRTTDSDDHSERVFAGQFYYSRQH